jgi:hypothetical protein
LLKTRPFLSGVVWRVVMGAAFGLLAGTIVYALFLLLALVNGGAL